MDIQPRHIDKSSILTRIASVISSVFSPLLMPTWCLMTAMWITTMQEEPEQLRIKSAMVVLAATCVVPMLVILWLLRMGYIRDLGVNRRRDRFIPLGLVVVCYGFSAWFLHHTNAPTWLSQFFIGGGICAAIALVVSLKWKISVHGMAMGGFLAMMFYIAFSGRSDLFMLPWLIGSVMLAGLVATSRLILKAHTPAQVYTGLAVGMVVVGAVLYLAPQAASLAPARFISWL